MPVFSVQFLLVGGRRAGASRTATIPQRVNHVFGLQNDVILLATAQRGFIIRLFVFFRI